MLRSKLESSNEEKEDFKILALNKFTKMSNENSMQIDYFDNDSNQNINY